jgi:membrane protease YdiL (CAAX protease family)
VTEAVKADPVAYHHLARWSAPGWWRTAIGTIMIVVGTLGLATVLYAMALVVGQIADLPRDPDDVPILPPLAEAALTFAAIAVGLPVVLLTTRLLQRRPAGTLSSVAGRLRWGWLARCLPVAFVTIALMFAAAFLQVPAEPAEYSDSSGGFWVGVGPFLGASLLMVLIVPLQAATEEYVFRGWLLQAVGALTRRLWPAILVQAVLFAAVHGWGTVWGFIDLVVWAAFMGWLTVRTGGLEASIALHTMNNLLPMIWSSAFGLFDIDETAADMSLFGLLVDLPLVTGYVLVVAWLARRCRLPVHAG